MVTRHFSEIITRVIAFYFSPKFRFRSISWIQLAEFHQILYMHISWQDLACSRQICTRVMALDLCQNLVSARYLENYLTYFHQILYMHSCWLDQARDCYTSFWGILYQSYGPLFMPKFHFRSLSWEPICRISQNFIYAFILARSSLGLSQAIFANFSPD